MLRTRDGDRFELQLHTPQSLDIKNRFHDLRKQERVITNADRGWTRH
ncbi:MAG TPA: hypothetical protein VFP68_11230 [Burkholderiaceae bacterium]|nr:hypothetical protein [Burkholderiaceae bacterium]